MTTTLTKEFRPLLLPVCVAVAGSLVPPNDDIGALLGSLACFGGFAVLAAMTFGLEFQQCTLSLLLTQPTERSRIWQDKLLVVFLSGIGLALLNWQFQHLLAQLPPASLLIVCMSILATVCSTGFWIQITGSTFGGLACSVLNQLLVFGGLMVVLRHEFTISPDDEVLLTIFLASVVYSLYFLWLGRHFWKGTFLKIGAAIIFLLLLCGLSQILAGSVPAFENSPAENCLTGIFLLATVCSVGFWTLLTRTTVGGAVLSVASQFLVGLGVLLGLSRIYGADPNIQQPRFLGPLGMISILYCAVFLWLGWRKFAHLELRDAPAGENLMVSGGFLYRVRWSPDWLRCRSDQNLPNLVRKELRLQKPLLMLAGIFLICWLAVYVLQWLQPDKGYANLNDLLICLYVPVALLLAGCISLGDEKALGLTAWHLALPVSARTQWLVKLVVATATGATLGLLLPFCLDLLPASAPTDGLFRKSEGDAWKAIAAVSGGLFVLSFWAATLLTSTVRAALSAVVALVSVWLCGMLGGWCAQHFLLSVFAPAINELIVESSALGVLGPIATALLLTSLIAVAAVLLQSFRQFRRVQLTTAVLVRAPLGLAGLFVLLGYVLGSVISAAG